MQLDFTTSSTGRADYGLPTARLVNVLVEATPAGPARSARLARPGLDDLYEVGVGPIVGMFQGSGVFGGDGFTVSGAELYKGETLIGVVNRSGLARFAASYDQLVVVTGGTAYCFDGEALTAITDPDLPMVSDVFYLAGRFYYLEEGTDTWWRSDIGDAFIIDGLAFATAESAPDANVGALVLYDEAWFFGSETVEPFSQTGLADDPLQRSLGRRFNRGCAAQATIVAIDNSALWVGDNRKVYRASDRPIRVSDDHIDGLLLACEDIERASAFRVDFQGHELYVLNIPGQGSHALDMANVKAGWVEWASFGLANFRCNHSVIADGLPYLGDALTGKVWKLDPDAYTDGGEPIEVVVSAGLTGNAGSPIRCNNIVLECATGVGLEAGTDALVDMRYADDKGRTWSAWRSRSMGLVGEFLKRPFWSRLGMFQRQRVFEFRSTAAVMRAFIAAHMNADRV